MITQQIYSLLALHVYDADPIENINKPLLPTGWAELPIPLVGTSGFAYAVYRNASTEEIVISYRGTDNLLSGDMLSNLGLSVSQERQAAEVYARVLRDHDSVAGGANISFTGHSLGGGLAGTMSVWFNRPATVFDPAPTEQGARDTLNVRYVIARMTAPVPQALLDYRDSISTQFAARESNVTSYFAPGSVVYTGNQSFNTITGAGQGNPVQFGIANMGSVAGRVDMHSQALLTAGILTTSFPTATVAVQAALPLIMSKSFYALPTSGSERNFLIDLIRSEQASPANGKLTHFAADLNKLGTNIAGLNKQALTAMIAQGIEWYYWQSSNYAGGKEFFTQTGQLFQYTTAKGDGLTGALSKADLYTKPWLQAISAEHGYGGSAGTSAFPAFGTAYDQWNVGAGTTGVTATARADNKAQIFIGQSGSDTFTGGSKDDVIFARGIWGQVLQSSTSPANIPPRQDPYESNFPAGCTTGPQGRPTGSTLPFPFFTHLPNSACG